MTRSFEKTDGLTELACLRAAVHASGDIVYDWDLATDTMSWSGRTGGLFGLDDNALPSSGEMFHGRVNPEDLPDRMRALSDHFAGTEVYDCEFRVRAEAGQFQWVHDRGAVEMSSGGAPTRLRGILRLVTSRKQHEAHLEYLANFDDLTGHFNKLRLREALDHALASALRFEQPGAFLAIGIDQLGMINTAYGFEVGDAILIEFAQRLDRCLRATDVIGRPGGDRFGVVLGRSTEDDARGAAERILQAMRGTPVQIGDAKVTVTASIGVVVFPAQSKTSFDVMAKAESALLRAKSSGRDCAHLFEMDDAQRQSYREAMDIGEDVKEAMKDDRLCLAYQPVVDARTRGTSYHECLIRMIGKDGTLVPAASFIPVVEQLGLMRNIDRHTLALSLEDLEAHPDITLAINISGLTATERSWLRILISRLKGRRDLARRLIVEITETAALQDIEESARFVASLRELGCRVALDDFGAGYTTFRHLKALTVDIVKIDGSFVRDIKQCEENQMFVRNLLSLANTLGVETVAECVETADDADFLASEGVDFLQGYYFGKPEVDAEWRKGNPKSAARKADDPQAMRMFPTAGMASF